MPVLVLLLLDTLEKIKSNVYWSFGIKCLRSLGKRSEVFSVGISVALFLGADIELVAFDAGVVCLSLNQFCKFRFPSYTISVQCVCSSADIL